MVWGSNLLIKKGKDVIACLNSSDQVALLKVYAKCSHICNLQLRKNDYLCRTEFLYRSISDSKYIVRLFIVKSKTIYFMFISKRNLSLLTLFVLVLQLFAQGPNNTGTYYKAATGKKGQALKTALYAIISPHHDIGYRGLYKCYEQTDRRADGKVWDIYSCTTNFSFSDNVGGYKREGDMYNREHTIPQSWFNEAKPMVADIVHVIPTDGYVNNRRSSFPFGETNSPTYTSNKGFSKVGPSCTEGYSGTVFEPNDEYKGDIARIYFYMATCYEDRIGSWTNGTGNTVIAGNKYPAYKPWVIKMLLRWAKEDPVSQKEIDRNNAVYKCQKNRNPYVDYPGLEQYVWGDKMNVAFSYDNYGSVDPTPNPDPTPDPNPDPTPDPNPDPVPGSGVTFNKVNADNDLTTGTYYLIVYENGENSKALAAQNGDVRSPSAVTITNDKIVTDVDTDGKPRQFLLGGSKGAYTFYSTVDKNYLAALSGKNKLQTTTDAGSANAKWDVTFVGEHANIKSCAFASRSINFNKGATPTRFAAYESKSNQQPVALYKRDVTSGIGSTAVQQPTLITVYSITGVAVKRGVQPSAAFDGLAKGVYVVGGKKYVVE